MEYKDQPSSVFNQVQCGDGLAAPNENVCKLHLFSYKEELELSSFLLASQKPIKMKESRRCKALMFILLLLVNYVNTRPVKSE